jgi:ribosomal protein S6--L-glutamate ligase
MRMHIGILSRGPGLYSTRRLVQVARKRRHRVSVFNTGAFSMRLEEGKPNIYYMQKPVSKCDAIIPRIGSSITFFGTAVVRQFEQMGVTCLNSSNAISSSRDKLRSLQMLSRHDVGIAATAFVWKKEDILPAIQAVGGVPVIIKLLEGTQGTGVILAESEKTAEAIVETLQVAKKNVLVQKFISESMGRDVRAFVVGGRVVAAMRRQAAGQEFRSNVHRGGKVMKVRLDKEFERTAIRAAQILGLNVAGVDMLEGKKGPKLMEVNSSPGLEGIEQATGVDVAGEIVKFLEAQHRFPELDLRERMTLDKGYGVAEIPVGPKSPLANHTIEQSALRQRDVMVLRITRGGLTISNPRPIRKMLAGDILLCFGKLVTMQMLLEKKKALRKSSSQK